MLQIFYLSTIIMAVQACHEAYDITTIPLPYDPNFHNFTWTFEQFMLDGNTPNKVPFMTHADLFNIPWDLTTCPLTNCII